MNRDDDLDPRRGGGRGCPLVDPVKAAIVCGLVIMAVRAWCQPVSGSMDVRWNEGAPDCTAAPQAPLQVHVYEPRTFILRQSPCANFEANFLYLLVGSDKALLVDSGAIADPEKMPLAKTVLGLLPTVGGSKMPLIIVHTHRHRDHYAGDPQFASLPAVQIVPAELDSVREFFGFAQWPSGVAQLALGDRTVDIIPTPGHTPDHLVLYDRRTALLFSGDFLLPGRLLIDDAAAYHESALRVVEFLKARPLTFVLGSHIELDATGQAYAERSQYHPNEHPLQLTKDDLLALPAALEQFNGFYARYPRFILSNPMHNLFALAITVIVVLTLIVWGVRRAFLRRRRRAL